jgi:tetratricopeptide (TPR) repeat protein
LALELKIDRWTRSFRTLSVIAALSCMWAFAPADSTEVAQPKLGPDAEIIPFSWLAQDASGGSLGLPNENAAGARMWFVRDQTPAAAAPNACFDAHARPGARIMDCTIALLQMSPSDPGRGILYAHRALAYYAVQEWQIALQDFEVAISFDPQLPLALNGRCWILASRALDLAQARQDCDKAIAADPTFHEAFDSRAMIAMREARWDAAWIDFNTAVSLRSGVATYLYGRGLASLALGAREAALSDLSAAVSLRPGVASEYRELGFDPSLPPFHNSATLYRR